MTYFMGAIRKRGKIYYIDFRAEGKRYKKAIGPSKSLAELALKDIEIKIAKKDLGFIEKDLPIEDLFKRFLEYSSTNHAPNTCRRYKTIINNFNKFLADHLKVKQVSQLSAGIIEKFKITRRKQGAKANTLNIEIKGLKVVFNQGVKWELINQNPASGVENLKVRDAKQPRFLSEEECKLLLDNCGEYLYPIFYTFLHTGMRHDELKNLEWSDIDFKSRKIFIRRKVNWAPKGKDRDLPMTKGLTAVLKKLKNKSIGTFVFENSDGTKLKRKLRRDLIRVAGRCGFVDVTKINSLRHTFASHLIMKGVDLPTVQRLLGHSDIKTTMIYSHLAPDHLVDAVNKLDFDN